MDTIEVPPPPPEVAGAPAEPPDYAMLERELGRAQAEEVIREFERAEAMSQIARYRHYIAKNHHKLKNGKDLDFDRYPFAIELYACDAQSMVVMGSVQWGKSLNDDALVHSPIGWRRNGDLKVGDLVSTPFGVSAKVLGVYPQGVVPIYRITVSDGSTAEASADHLWETRVGDRSQVVETKRIAADLAVGVNHAIPKARVDEGACSIDTWLDVVSIKPCGEKSATCIYIDHPRHLYITNDLLVSHNTEFALVTCAAMAGYGLKVFFVFSKIEKRNKVVADRIDPAFASIPLYRAMTEGARKERKALADSTGLKHFGKGGINFVGSNSEKDFTSFDADVAVIDEHQECEPDNISGVFERMSGSPYRFQIILGNPRLTGTKENNNLDWQYQQSDQRQWHVPCDHCGHMQVLDWWQHFIEEKKSSTGAILTIQSRDTEWDPEGVLDMRPICLMCKQPMDRLNREGKWVARNPGHRRRGYNLSNLYNVNVRMGGPESLLERYIAAQYSPMLLAKFWNDQLGLAFTQDGTNITDRMLAQASTGEGCNLAPYLFSPADQLKWSTLEAEAA